MHLRGYTSNTNTAAFEEFMDCHKNSSSLEPLGYLGAKCATPPLLETLAQTCHKEQASLPIPQTNAFSAEYPYCQYFLMPLAISLT